MSVPTEDDWRSEAWCLDTEYAYENFHGKTREEAVRLFEENALRYQEDVMFMPGRVFGYYLGSYIDYLRSEVSKDDWDGASCFINLINFKSEHDRDYIAALWSEIEPTLKKIAERQDDNDANWEIYSSFRAEIHEIERRGFPVSFDTTIPEFLSPSATLTEIALKHEGRVFSFPVAVQIFRNLGIGPIDTESEKPEILHLFGAPDAVGREHHPEYGEISNWARFDRSDCSVRFEFAGDVVACVTFMPAGSSMCRDRST